MTTDLQSAPTHQTLAHPQFSPFPDTPPTPRVGIEPTTFRLTAGRSATKLTGKTMWAVGHSKRECRAGGLSPADKPSVGNEPLPINHRWGMNLYRGFLGGGTNLYRGDLGGGQAARPTLSYYCLRPNSEWEDLNPRPSVPKTDALTSGRHSVRNLLFQNDADALSRYTPS